METSQAQQSCQRLPSNTAHKITKFLSSIFKFAHLCLLPKLIFLNTEKNWRLIKTSPSRTTAKLRFHSCVFAPLWAHEVIFMTTTPHKLIHYFFVRSKLNRRWVSELSSNFTRAITQSSEWNANVLTRVIRRNLPGRRGINIDLLISLSVVRNQQQNIFIGVVISAQFFPANKKSFKVKAKHRLCVEWNSWVDRRIS